MIFHLAANEHENNNRVLVFGDAHQSSILLELGQQATEKTISSSSGGSRLVDVAVQKGRSLSDHYKDIIDLL